MDFPATISFVCNNHLSVFPCFWTLSDMLSIQEMSMMHQINFQFPEIQRRQH